MTYQHYTAEFKAKIVLEILQGERIRRSNPRYNRSWERGRRNLKTAQKIWLVCYLRRIATWQEQESGGA